MDQTPPHFYMNVLKTRLSHQLCQRAIEDEKPNHSTVSSYFPDSAVLANTGKHGVRR
jgi:hypothetical protein